MKDRDLRKAFNQLCSTLGYSQWAKYPNGFGFTEKITLLENRIRSIEDAQAMKRHTDTGVHFCPVCQKTITEKVK